jgi:HEAT repeat protein
MPLIRKDAIALPPAEMRPSALQTLRTGTPDERRSAARAIAASAVPGFIAGATQALGSALQTETDLRVREAIFTSLVRIGGRESADTVVPCLRSDDAQLRTGAVDALRAMTGAVQALLPDLLCDPDSDVRLLACDLARELPTPEATSLLCDVLSRDTEANVCAAAVDVLADIGGKDALPFLRACAVRFGDVTFLSFATTMAMERITAERAVRNE